MAGRPTNLALALLVVIAIGTGLGAYAVGTASGRAVVVAHGVFGFAMVLLSPWKGTIVGRGLRRKRAGRILSIVLAAAFLATISSGVLFSTGLVLAYGPLSAMQVHVGAGVLTAVLIALHVRARPVRPRLFDLSRRNLLRAGALTGGAGLLWLGLEGTAAALGWRGASRRFTGSHETGSFAPALVPVTQWLDDPVPHIDPSDWHLQVRAAESRLISHPDLLSFDDRLLATLDCTGGWYATLEWTGVRLDRILGRLEGGSILVRSVTGYERRFPIEHAEHLLLAHSVGGAALSVGHGWPARLVAPGRRGFWWVKWVTEISHDPRPSWWQSPFPLS